MVSITKLFLTLRKKLFFVSVVLLIEKARSYRMTLGITEVILTGFTSSMHYFSPRVGREDCTKAFLPSEKTGKILLRFFMLFLINLKSRN